MTPQRKFSKHEGGKRLDVSALFYEIYDQVLHRCFSQRKEQVRTVVCQYVINFFKAHRGFSCLLAMRARTNTKVVVRHRYLKIAKYAIRHVDIIVLPCVDNHFVAVLS